MSDEGTPDENEPKTTGPLGIVQIGDERIRGFLRIIFGICLGVLLVGDIALYTLYQTLSSQNESQERRIERFSKMVNDLLVANQNAEKIEKIEQQVNGIEDQITGLTDTLKAQDRESEKTPGTAGR